MGKQVRFSVEARSAASPPAIYALLGDGSTWPRWTPFRAFELEREGGERCPLRAVQRGRPGQIALVGFVGAGHVAGGEHVE